MSFPDLASLHHFATVVAQVHYGIPALGVLAGDWLVARPYHPDRPFVLQRPATPEIIDALWTPDRVTVLHVERRDRSQPHLEQRPFLLP